MHDDRMASSVDEYWERRRELSPSSGRPAVADGDRRLALVVDVSDSGIRSQYERLADRLGEFGCLRPVPPGELHLTVKLFDRRTRDGDAAAAPSLSDVDDLVRATLADASPFELTVPRLNLFPDTVYAEVDDDGRLAALNERLCDHDRTMTSDRDRGQFLPHLTLGYFTGDREYDRLVDFLEAERSLSWPAVSVTELTLAEYEVTGRTESASKTLETYSL